jgi:hypothetical protein
MRAARHGNQLVAPGEADQGGGQPQDGPLELQQEGPAVQAQGGQDLVVAAAAGVDLLARLPQAGHQEVLDGGVAILVRRRDGEAARQVQAYDFRQASVQGGALPGGQQADLLQHGGVSHAGQAIRVDQVPVQQVVPAHGVALDQLVQGHALLPQLAHGSACLPA